MMGFVLHLGSGASMTPSQEIKREMPQGLGGGGMNPRCEPSCSPGRGCCDTSWQSKGFLGTLSWGIKAVAKGSKYPWSFVLLGSQTSSSSLKGAKPPSRICLLTVCTCDMSVVKWARRGSFVGEVANSLRLPTFAQLQAGCRNSHAMESDEKRSLKAPCH